MTTSTAAALTESQQALIDARLDTIDRMLIDRMPRSQRIEIVSEVESQIHELLSQHDAAEITREDVLDTLRRLDPPEAYLAEEWEHAESARPRSFVACPPATRTLTRSSLGDAGRLGGILGLCSLVPAIYPLAFLTQSMVLYLIGMASGPLLGLSASILALVLSIRGRRDGAMPIIGIITGSISILMFLFGIGFVVLSQMNL